MILVFPIGATRLFKGSLKESSRMFLSQFLSPIKFYRKVFHFLRIVQLGLYGTKYSGIQASEVRIVAMTEWDI